MSKRGTKMIRVKDEVVQALRMYAGEIQAESGTSLSDSDAVQELIKALRPDLLIKVRTKTQTEKKQPGKRDV
jgi:hypothetical protein